MRTTRIMLVLLLAMLNGACATEPIDRPELRILFVGNSLVYVGNLPAVFDALAKRNGRPVQSDMLVSGGATLSERLEDGSVDRALRSTKYDYVILQERGGDFLCEYGIDACKRAATSLRQLATMARDLDARPLLLGTYQGLPKASRAIVAAESSAAASNGIPYVAISNRLHVALQASPSGDWLHRDRMHPGHQLVLLEAITLYRTLYGSSPKKTALRVTAPMHEPDSMFPAEAVRNTFRNDAANSATMSHFYSAEEVMLALNIASRIAP